MSFLLTELVRISSDIIFPVSSVKHFSTVMLNYRQERANDLASTHTHTHFLFVNQYKARKRKEEKDNY